MPCAKVPRCPVPLTGTLAAGLPGALLSLPILLHHALVLPPQLLVTPHPLAVLLDMGQIGRTDRLHDILEPHTRLADRTQPVVCATRHPVPVASGRSVFK